jgi:hypothetical protein
MPVRLCRRALITLVAGGLLALGHADAASAEWPENPVKIIAPFLLGFILAPKFEDNLRRTLLIGDDGGVFFRSPICWIFIALFLASLSFGLWREWQDSRSPAATAEPTP